MGPHPESRAANSLVADVVENELEVHVLRLDMKNVFGELLLIQTCLGFEQLFSHRHRGVILFQLEEASRRWILATGRRTLASPPRRSRNPPS